MPLADTAKAIGKVTELLQEHLEAASGVSITVGRPEPPKGAGSLPKPRLNLFLFEATFDPHLKNVPLEEGRPPPLWMVLRFLLTAYDDDGETDTIAAHEKLGEGLRALQRLNYPPLSAVLPTSVVDALEPNPEPLKITFDEAPSDLLSKLMQGSEEKYRFSMTFQVRPVMIATGEPPSFSTVVGVDQTAVPPEEIGEQGIELPVLPSLGPVIEAVEPARFEAGDTLRVRGGELGLSGLSVRLGPAELPVTAQRPDRLRCEVDGDIPDGAVISAGGHALAVVQTLPGGRRRSSNLLVGELRPTLDTATILSVHGVASPAGPRVAGEVLLEGTLLGREADDIAVALHRDGAVVALLDQVFTFVTDQSALRLTVRDEDAVEAGSYRVILRVNGQQATKSPAIEMVV